MLELETNKTLPLFFLNQTKTKTESNQIESNQIKSINQTHGARATSVAPKWTNVPADVDAVAGQHIVVDCQAQASPAARIW